MPNIKSAKKRLLVTKGQTERNKSEKTNLRTVLKKADAAISTDASDKTELVGLAVKKLDQAVSKGLLHKNNAARKKSSLVLRLTATKA